MTDSLPPLTEAELSQCLSAARRLWQGLPVDAEHAESAIVSVTFPRLPVERLVQWFGRRLIFWPKGIQQRHRVAILSSRLGKRKDQKTWWFDGLRTSLLRCDAPKDCLTVVEGTTAEEYVARGSELFGIPRLRIHFSAEVVSSEADLLDWLREVQHRTTSDSAVSQLESNAWISPQLTTTASDIRNDRSPADAILTMAGERIVALHCLAEGNVETVLSRRMEHDDLSKPIVLLAVTDKSPPASEAVMKLGGVPWYLNSEHLGKQPVSQADFSAIANRDSTFPSDGPLESPAEWLCHWTRPSFGPWLDQPSDDFMDELILGCETADRSAVAALLRIMSQQKIIASVSTAGEPPTVSFTAVALADFRQRRIFRRHKQRFDFEPWGIAIRKSVLEAHEAEAVEYLTADSPESSARFTQRQFDKNNQIDWSTEREWRLAGDLNLNDLPDDSVCVFVDSLQTMNQVQMHSRWRTMVVPG